MPELASAADPSVDPKLAEQLRYDCVLDFKTGTVETTEHNRPTISADCLWCVITL